MKRIYTIVFLIVIANNTYSLNVIEESIDPNGVQNTIQDPNSIKEFLLQIEKKYDVFFNYNDDLLKEVKISKHAALPENKSELDDYLGDFFSTYNLRYEKINEHTYIIKSKNKSPIDKKIEETESTGAEPKIGKINAIGKESIIAAHILEGTVTSIENGEGLPGATVRIKNTNLGAITDLFGKYKLEIANESLPVVLVVSFIGYKTQEIAIVNQAVVDVILDMDVASLEEIVVTGYGQQKRSNLTGSISTVKGTDLANRPIVRLDQALAGLSSGVFVSKGGGAPGSRPTIHIRGVGSISNSNPLWIVDGIKMDPGNHFNLDDVESIEILKDAAASAIYGAQAAHGVILVTTKRGKEGELKISYRSSFAKINAISFPQLLGSEDFVAYKKESRLNAGQNPEPSWDNWEHDTDWIKAYYAGSGFSHYHDVSIAKGTEKSNYYFSLGYDKETGILIDNDFDRFSLRFNSDFKLAKWLTFGESILISRVNENPIDNFNEDYNGSIPFRTIPIMPIYDETNPYGGWGRAPVYFQGPNAVASQFQQHEQRHYNRLDGNIYLTVTPIKGLVLTGRVGYNYMSYLGRAFKEAFDYGAFANPINSLTYADANDETVTGNFITTYSKSIGKNNFSIMGGLEASKFSTVHYNVTATDFPVDYAESFNLATGVFNTTDRQTVYDSQLSSQFGRVTYNYNEKYLLEANVRRDASAPKFGPKNIWGVFPSFSLGWRIIEENFMDNISFISNLKLRGSTGRLGSDNINSFIYEKTYTSQFSTYSFDQSAQNKVSGFYVSKFPNTEVKWEEVNMHNIGADIGIFEEKVSLLVDFYIKDTKDLLYAVPIPASVGIATHNFNPLNPEVNIGTMRNSGIDLDLSYRDKIGNFNVTVNGNTSFLKNEVLHLNGDEYITGGDGGGQIGGMTRTEAGRPISSFYGFVVQQMLNSPNDVFAINSWAPDGIYQEAGTGAGDLMYKDLSGPDGVPDGQITWEHDRTYIGNPWPKMMYGVNINADYKKIIDILFQFQGVEGVDIFNANKAYSRNFFGDNNTTTEIYEAWTPENNTSHPRNIASDPNGNFSRPSTYFIEDGSYFKLRNVQIGFNMPPKLLESIGINKIRLFFNASNLLTITKYTGADPEIAGSNVGRGVDYGLYPHTRTFGGGIDVQF